MMITRHATALLFTLTALLLASVQAHADQKDFGEYTVLWSVFPSTFLAPEVAKANDLQRGNGIGVVNIAIMREAENGQLKPVNGQVEGSVSNDIQQTTFLGFRRIKEGDAVYFIAQYQYQSGGMMTFNVTAQPAGSEEDLPVRFTHTLFQD
ncbi:MAG: hypothetical protein AWU57_4579 [Marinobacter sp. T13-3]|nr:MAG: hypothetical protein AWU57_4579 [Marinobacter sp. T13-3]